MICRNCNTSFPDNMSYCPRCKAPVARPNYSYAQRNYQPRQAGYPQQRVQRPMPQPVTAGAPNNASNNSGHNNTAIAIIISITAIVVVLIIGAVLAFTTKTKSNTDFAKYQAMLQAYTSNPVVDVQELDFDNDNSKEAYIITGIKTVDGFENGDIWFIDSYGAVHSIKHHVNGKPGVVVYAPNKKPYVTYEIYNTDRTVHNTYVYGVKNANYYEPPISGNYIDLHLDGNNKFIGQSKSDEKSIQFDFNDALEIVKSYADENNITITSKAQEQPTPTTSKTVLEKTTNKTTERTTQASGTGWKKAYGDYARNKMSEGLSKDYGAYFNLIYLNDDDIPELIIGTDSYHAAHSDLVTYKNSSAVKLGDYGEYGTIRYVERTGVFYCGWTQHGSMSIDKNIFDGNTVTVSNASSIPSNAKISTNNSYKLTEENISKYLA